MAEHRQVEERVLIDTTPERAFEAVTEASELREWFCDQAFTQVRPGGRFGLHWNQGYHVEGQFVEIEPPERAVVTWRGTGEPGETEVEFTVGQTRGGVKVTVAHSSFGAGEAWDEALAEAKKGWEIGLENLKSTLETGVDLRQARQPFLGITLDLLTPERAEQEGIAAEHGIYVTGTVEGSGAEAAGLCDGDVIVALGGQETPGFQELGQALRAHQAGDTVSVELVRGQEQETVEITLGQRPQPDVPDSAKALTERLAEQHGEMNEELRAAVAGLTENEAATCPNEGEWSVKQVLAHLVENEESGHVFLFNIAVNGWLDGGNVSYRQYPGRIEALLAVTPTIQGLLDRYLMAHAETMEMLRRLPKETVAHKARFRRMAEFELFGPDHVREHIGQIQNIVEALGEG